jgi:hypothetical protein
MDPLLRMDPARRAAALLKRYEETALLKDSVRSVVYHLKNAIVQVEHWEDIAEEEIGCGCPFASDETEKMVKESERKLWYSVQPMKWLQGDGEKEAWIEVKEREGPRQTYRWIRIDEPHHVRLLQTVLLPEECERQNLRVDRYAMHEYEAWGAQGFGRKRRRTRIPRTFEEMRMTFHRVGFPIALCGPHTQPAEDAPEDDEPPTAGTAATDFDSPGGRHILRWAPAATGRDAAVAVIDDYESDEWFLLFGPPDDVPPAAAAETAASAYEAQPPATDEAPTKQPPKKRVSFSIEEPQFHSVPSR